MLAFGLRWFALIGSNVPKLARSRGRRLRATHYVVGGAPATVAGFGRARPGLRRSRPAWSSHGAGVSPPQAAAQLFALLYPEGAHSLVRLPDGRHWLAAAQGGAVLSQADKLFGSLEEARREQQALLALRPGLREQDGELVWAAMMRAVEPGAALAALPSRWAELPLALRVFLVCIGLAAAAPPLWNTAFITFVGPTAVKPEPASVPDPQVDAYRALVHATLAHAPAELGRLLAGVGKLPIQVSGWALRRAQCDSDALQWNCAAVYVRAHPQATNHGLYALLPDGWQVSFKPLEEATLMWRMASGALRLADMTLPAALHVDTQVVGGLQGLRPAFASVSLSPAAPLMPLMPRMAAAPQTHTGQAAPSLPDMPVIRRRALVLHGPLRSMALLPGPISAARWSRLVVNVQPQLQPSLTSSALVAELQGDIYEQE
ncbi:hypothetical protein [Achromobacter arsenitoxydans]|uniref:Uncharacterized protein n=1 Tax=Achromobacter arsenitoxydans SY8 TaxID=477184 RepID=H0FA48_9BURK|nr:hypothetical protein [Achromobacter arsenitoxydans]EHK64855.1 hypothetical protein KYC_18630 [Achromobacter arsenitoxydans SY8]